MTTLQEEFIAGVSEMMDLMPRQPREAVRDMAATIAIQCGESPDAWRGAVATAVCVVGTLVKDSKVIDDLNPRELVVMSVMSVLVSLKPAIAILSEMVDGADLEDLP